MSSAKQQKLSKMERTPGNAGCSAEIFKLDIECFDEICDYLTTENLLSLGQTCKMMQRVVGKYFKANYTAASKFGGSDGIYRVFSSNRTEPAQISGFNEFVRYISHTTNGLGPLRYIESHSEQFESIIHINFESFDLTRAGVNCLQQILSKLEIVQFKQCTLQCHFYEAFLKHCTNLQRLYIQNDPGTFIECEGNEWLLQRYPMLEHLELFPKKSTKINISELNTFFELNPNCRSFSTSSLLLLRNQDDFMSSTIKLDVLEIKENGHGFFNDFGHLNIRDFRNVRDFGDKGRRLSTLFKLLNQLYERGFYKQLHLRMSGIDQKSTDKLINLHALEKLSIRSFVRSYSLNFLADLKELAIFDTTMVEEMERIARGMTKLERIYLSKGTEADILPFVQHSIHLNRIVLKDELNLCGILQMKLMNDERQKLDGAQKIAIYVPDKVFVETKQATKGGGIDLQFVHVIRSDSYRWDHFYS